MVLAQHNSTRFAIDFAAAVAGERQCAVLDPTWPQPMRDEIIQRLGSAAVSAPDAPGEPLKDGDPSSSFLIGLTSGTTSVPKAFTRSRQSWQ
jgi:acyl-coenzyme A synthetase/AMP-(fatty) acid ligase